MDSIPANKGAEEDAHGFAKTFPEKNMCCPKCLVARLCGSAFQKNGLAFLQELDDGGN